MTIGQRQYTGALGEHIRTYFLLLCGIADNELFVFFLVLFRLYISTLEYFPLLQLVFHAAGDLRFICGLLTFGTGGLHMSQSRGKGKVRGKGVKRRKTEGLS